ncbi:hypothetical protein [Gracilibacillus sp. YIM 98692]|uniref:hypothetical protein n=1 Tax=Gracilibacillus sp. YIM 98692 TaxID=2663532 RepID=UPI0013D4DA55|nr:hypothetical protein [Gracilibacillus sp. YIM 98692]
MDEKRRFEKQVENVREETNSSAVLNDVVDTEFEQYPGQNESIMEEDPLTPSQEILQDQVYGKTWNRITEERREERGR